MAVGTDDEQTTFQSAIDVLLIPDDVDSLAALGQVDEQLVQEVSNWSGSRTARAAVGGCMVVAALAVDLARNMSSDQALISQLLRMTKSAHSSVAGMAARASGDEPFQTVRLVSGSSNSSFVQLLRQSPLVKVGPNPLVSGIVADEMASQIAAAEEIAARSVGDAIEWVRQNQQDGYDERLAKMIEITAKYDELQDSQ